MNKLTKISAGLMLAGSLGMVGNAQAVLLIDDFTTTASVTDTSSAGSTNVDSTDFTATSLTGADRHIAATASSSTGAKQDVDVLGGALGISNNSFSSGANSTSLLYDGFGSVDFTAAGSAIIMNVLGIDLGVSVQMIVNGVSSSAVVAFTGPGVFHVNFSSFSDPTQFTHVSTLELLFTGTGKWDATFDFITTDEPPSVPEPDALGLLSIGLLGMGAQLRRNRKTSVMAA